MYSKVDNPLFSSSTFHTTDRVGGRGGGGGVLQCTHNLDDLELLSILCQNHRPDKVKYMVILIYHDLVPVIGTTQIAKFV